MSEVDDGALRMAGSPFGGAIPLSEVRAELQELEAYEDEVRHRLAQLRAVLPPEHFRLAWALRDAEEKLGVAGRRLAERRLVEELAQCLPEHGPAIRAAARRLLAGAEAV